MPQMPKKGRRKVSRKALRIIAKFAVAVAVTTSLTSCTFEYGVVSGNWKPYEIAVKALFKSAFAIF